jgi:cell division inhibitor SulA
VVASPHAPVERRWLPHSYGLPKVRLADRRRYWIIPPRTLSHESRRHVFAEGRRGSKQPVRLEAVDEHQTVLVQERAHRARSSSVLGWLDYVLNRRD